MAAASWIRVVYRAHFSKPRNARQLYQLVRRSNAARIIEIGISDVQRSVWLIEVAQRYATGRRVFHTALDEFDARAEGLASLSIKEAHRLLHPTGASVRLVPGPPAVSLAAVSNAHQNTDLVLISANLVDGDLHGAWFYLPRMLHHQSVILREHLSSDGPSYERLTHCQIAELAGQSGSRRAA